MPENIAKQPRSILVSGASIAGPAIAYWLDRYGFDVTVVERAGMIRGGGYLIDVRGTALDVVERMGVLRQLRDEVVDIRKLSFVGSDGRLVAAIEAMELTGGIASREIELPRGALSSILYDLTRNGRIRYRFNDSIDALTDDGTGVDVRFESGAAQRFDIVVGADGIHSNTRALTFGPEPSFNRYLGYCFTGFPMTNDLGLSHEAVTYAEAGRSAAVFAAGDPDMLQGLLNFATDKPPFRGHPDIDKQRHRTAEQFRDAGWICSRLVDAMWQADDLFVDTVSQIHMPKWSCGRVVLAGDAAHAPSFPSGQGSSLALVGACVLAGELASHTDPKDAFAAYESRMRPFAEANQALERTSFLMPRTQQELDRRNAVLVEAKTSGQRPERAIHRARVHNALTLPEYGIDHREARSA